MMYIVVFLIWLEWVVCVSSFLSVGVFCLVIRLCSVSVCR